MIDECWYWICEAACCQAGRMCSSRSAELAQSPHPQTYAAEVNWQLEPVYLTVIAVHLPRLPRFHSWKSVRKMQKENEAILDKSMVYDKCLQVYLYFSM